MYTGIVPVLPTIMNLQVKPGPEFYRDVADRKSIRFQSSTRIHQARRIQKRNTLESGFKKICGFGVRITAYVWTEGRFVSKNISVSKTYGFDEAAFDSMRGALAK